MKLNLGCGRDYRDGYVNVDRDSRVKCDSRMDVIEHLCGCPCNSIDEILMQDILEHLPDTVLAIDLCWDALKPGGILKIRVPFVAHPNAWLDPDHKHCFWPETFLFFDPETTAWTSSEKQWKILRLMNDSGSISVEMQTRKAAVNEVPYGFDAGASQTVTGKPS